MKDLQIFNNPEFGEIRFVEVDEKPYAVGVDVARMLNYAKPSQAVIDHCKGIRKLEIPSEGGIQETNIIPEGDIYRLIIKAADQSKNEEIRAKAERFEKWVFDEVIPSIRKTGKYELPQDEQIKLLAGQVEQYKEFTEAYSDQLASGFPDHKPDYLTEKEAYKVFKRPNGFFRHELVNLGYLELQWGVLRITEKGKEFGEEFFVSNRRRYPFVFRWKREVFEKIITSWDEWRRSLGDY
ncbi:MAG: hypothetical protein A4E55_00368 [Pelotomaculum sp. PtaU1.Bin035]|nr:MAG: hypothetical protein A4E55_00368 [Pelotomaculum sp. PtaU1.Bin035]